MKKPVYKYELTIENALLEIVNDSDLLRPEKAVSIINNMHPQFRFIDLRNPAEFNKGHLDGAINIPFKDLLADDYKEVLNQDEKINILYCNSEMESKEAVLLLKQIGYINNKVLLGGYQFITTYILDDYKTKAGIYPDDKAAYDYAKVASETKGFSNIEQKSVPKKVVIKTQRVKSTVAGGC